MRDEMTLARFRALSGTYGGVIHRWPEAERDAAARLLARDPQAIAVIEQAASLDARLDTWRVPAPATALAASIVASAPDTRRRLVRRARLWWSGVGMATALMGAAAGTAAVAAITPTPLTVDGSSAFGDVGSDSAS